MKRTWFLASVMGLALLISVWAATHTSARNEETKKETAAAQKSPTAAQLPIQQVVLFSSGVGYFQREGNIDGSERIDLTFPVADINDLIKSMTLRDLDGGRINAVSYDSNVPVERTLQSFAINLTGNPNFAGILNQARGEKVEVILQQTNAAQPGTLTGSIVGVETKKIAVGKDNVAEEKCLNLWCADGMRSLKLSEVARVRFLNAIMESEFRKALETLALGHDTQKKSVSIHFDGQGKPQVRVGYVIENPIWKTSYRLVLPTVPKKEDAQDEKKNVVKKPYMQGWAVVENTTDEDWNDIKMALISGRPISFQMNLYDSLFIQRPVVEPELFASLRPVTYSGGFGIAGGGPGGGGGGIGGPPAADDGNFSKDKAATFAPAERKKMDQLSEQLKRSYRETDGRYKEGLQKELAQDLDLGRSVSSAAQASKLGDYFQYAIDHAVTLPRQKSALLPILGTDVEGDRVSIFNERTHPKFPLLGLIFKNTTGMHLTQGPITVYEGSTYAGDARILDLQKDERRLLSYAIDLGTEVQAIPATDNGRVTSVKIDKGIIWTKTKVKDTRTYKIANRNDVDRVVMIEHPNRTDFTLTSKDKPWEAAADVHRFKVTALAGKTTDYVVAEEKDFGSSVTITNADDQNIRLIINEKVTSPAVKLALEKAVSLRNKLSATQREIQQVERQLAVITNDQDRLRKNLKEMPPEAAAYKRYLKKFDDQETEIERMQKLIKELQDGEHVQRKEFENYLTGLTVE